MVQPVWIFSVGIYLIHIKKSNHLKKCPKTVWIFMRILWAIKNQFCPRAKNVLRYLFCSMKFLLLKNVILSSSSSEDNTIKLQSNQPFHLEASWQGQKVVKIELMLFFRVELFARWLSPTTVDYKHFQPPKTSLNENCIAIKGEAERISSLISICNHLTSFAALHKYRDLNI